MPRGSSSAPGDPPAAAGDDHRPGGRHAAATGFSLGTRVFLLVAGLNVAIFAAAGGFLWDRLSDQAQKLTIQELAATLRASISPRGANVANILAWPGWAEIEDAYLVDRNLVRRSSGELQPKGIALHPVGSATRDRSVSSEVLLEGLDLAMRQQSPVILDGGRALPIEIDGEIWGACWYRLRERGDPGSALRILLPWFVVSTALLTAGGFLTLRRLVLIPVERLAQGAQRMSDGELAVEVPRTGTGDEIDSLVASFNGMARRVEGFNRELADRVAEATEQARRAEQAAMIQQRLAAMGELAAGIAHEINNPLGGLQNAVVALGKPDLADERRLRYLELLSSGLERIRGTVGQVLRMAPREVRPTPVELHDVVEDARALVAHRADGSGIELAVVLRSGGTVTGSRNELGQGVLNLLVNALDSVDAGRAADPPRGGRIELRVEDCSDGCIAIVVEDDGPGADAETLARASDLFFSTKDPGRGTGLGLAIVHNVAETHGGRLELESRPGEFFRARLCLPRAHADAGGAGS